MKRLFLALPVPPQIEEETVRCRTGLPGARWMEGMHLTLHFFGDLPPDREEVIHLCLEDLSLPAFEMRLGGPGVFAHPGQLIVWLRCIPEEPVLDMQRRLDRRLAREGFALEKRFHPHVTLARVRSIPQNRLNAYLLQFEDFLTSPFRVDELVLFSSVLQRDGARHRVEAIRGFA